MTTSSAAVLEDDDFGPRPPSQAQITIKNTNTDTKDSDDDFGPARPANLPISTSSSVSTSDEKKTKRKNKRPAAYYQIHSERLPDKELYERSFMHRDTVTHLVYTKTDFLITTSKDGIVKFWKKVHASISFVKQFIAHTAPFTGVSASSNGGLLATVAKDEYLKIFDVENFDMIHQLKLPYLPGTCAFISAAGAPQRVAVADSTSGVVHVYRAQGGQEPLLTVNLHQSPVKLIKFNEPANIVVTTDAKGM